MKSLLKTARRIPARVRYLLMGVAILSAYCYGWTVLTNPATSFRVIRSQVTVVFLAFLVMFALWLSRITKPMPRWKGWLVWVVAMVVFILVFKYLGGFQTNII